MKSLYEKYGEIIRYLIIGVCTTVVSLVTKYALLFTVLDAKKPLELQIAVVISWIVSVSFAYVTNRLFVFQSKNRHFFQEIGLFVSSRIVTLGMESVLLWFFINFLHLDSNFYVIVWTIVTQGVVIVGNYVLSKWIVFTNHSSLLSNIPWGSVLIILGLLVLTYFFPYTHDDWDWGSRTGLSRLENGFQDFNGRYAGNVLVLLLTRYRFFRTCVMTLSFVLLALLAKVFVSSKNKSLPWVMGILLLMMPTRMVAQAIAWTAGYANYVIPVVLAFFILYQNRHIFASNSVLPSNIYWVPFLLTGIFGTLFIEHMTVYHVLLALFLVGYGYIHTKKINIPNLFYLFGTILGTYGMFFNGHLSAQADYRQVADGNLLKSAISTYFGQFYQLLVRDNVVLIIVLSILLLMLGYQYEKKNKHLSTFRFRIIRICSMVQLFYLTYIGLSKVVTGTALLGNKGEGLLVFLYGLSVLGTIAITITDSERKFRLFTEMASVVLIAAPLLIVTPIGPRCFFPTYCFLALIVVELWDILFSKTKVDYEKILRGMVLVSMCFYLGIYGKCFFIEQKRAQYLENHRTDEELVLPKIPYEKYMQHPNPISEWFDTQFKLFYHIDEQTKLEFVSYTDWKKITRKQEK